MCTSATSRLAISPSLTQVFILNFFKILLTPPLFLFSRPENDYFSLPCILSSSSLPSPPPTLSHPFPFPSSLARCNSSGPTYLSRERRLSNTQAHERREKRRGARVSAYTSNPHSPLSLFVRAAYSSACACVCVCVCICEASLSLSLSYTLPPHFRAVGRTAASDKKKEGGKVHGVALTVSAPISLVTALSYLVCVRRESACRFPLERVFDRMRSSTDSPRAPASLPESHAAHVPIETVTASPTSCKSLPPHLALPPSITLLHAGALTPRSPSRSCGSRETHLNETDASRSQHPLSPNSLSPKIAPGTQAKHRLACRGVSTPSLPRRLGNQFPVRELPSPVRDKCTNVVEAAERPAAQLSISDVCGSESAANPHASVLLGSPTRFSENSLAAERIGSSQSSLFSTPMMRRPQGCMAKDSPDFRETPAPHTSPPALTFTTADLTSVDGSKRMWNMYGRQDGWVRSPRADCPISTSWQSLPSGFCKTSPCKPARAAASRTASRSVGREGEGSTRSVALFPSVSVAATCSRDHDQHPPSQSVSLPTSRSEGWPRKRPISSAKPLSPMRESKSSSTDRSSSSHVVSGGPHFFRSVERAPVYRELLALDRDVARGSSEAATSLEHRTQSSQRLDCRRYSANTSPVYNGGHTVNALAASTDQRMFLQIKRQPQLLPPDSTVHRGVRSSSNRAHQGVRSVSSTPLSAVMGVIPRENFAHRLGSDSTQSPSFPQMQPPPASPSTPPLSRTRTPGSTIVHDHSPCSPLRPPELTPTAMERLPEQCESAETLVDSCCYTPPIGVVEQRSQQILRPRLSTSPVDQPTEHSTASIQDRDSLGHRVRLCSQHRKSVVNGSISIAGSSRSSSSNASRRCSYSSALPAAALPPPPPWTPREALYWMRNRLTLQEQEEMLGYDKVYYCGPPLQPRTARRATYRGKSPPPTHHTLEEIASMSSLPKNREEVVAFTAPSTSYFPITLGMHICFRYEVLEVLGVGTFGIVVRAVDHAASPLSPERHCALKLIRREVLYQKAAQAEWAICEQLKDCCAAMRPCSGSSFKGETSGGTADYQVRASVHRQNSTLFPLALPSLSTVEQQTLLFGSVLTPRGFFEYRGYHVIVFPLLGFSVRDVVELRRESREAKAGDVVNASSSLLPASSSPSEADEQAAMTLPTEVVGSVLAQVMHALHFMHHCAHVLHGDIKPENIVFVDRSVTGSSSNVNSYLVESGGVASQQPPLLQVSLPSNADAGALATPLSMHPFHRLSIGFPLSVSSTAAHPLPVTPKGTSPCRSHATEYPEKNSSADVSGRGSPSNSTSMGSSSLPCRTVPRPPARNTEIADCHDGDTTVMSCSHSLQHLGGEVASCSERRSSGGDLLYRHTTDGASVSLAVCSPCMTDTRIGVLTSSAHATSATTGFVEGSAGYGVGCTALGKAAPCSSGSSPEASPRYTTHLGHDNRSGVGGSGDAANNTVAPSAFSRLTYGLPHAMATSTVATTSSRIALIDLGHAHHILPGTTVTAFPLQSPSYRCPEMSLRLPYTTAIDMWSVGCILYELRTGHALFPDACDDTTMLQSAVRVLGMPDAAFLATVKTCWKGYKQHRASLATAAACVQAEVTTSDTSLQKVQLHLRQAHPQEPQRAVDSEDVKQDEEAINVERCWREFIQVLNNAAGHQREHERRLKHRQESSTPPVTENSQRSPRKTGSPLANGSGCTTTWETAEQLALLKVMFPEGQAHESDQCFSLPSKCDWHRYAWVDFMLGCLYWDAGERLTATEARAHPYLASNFSAEVTDATTVTTNNAATSSGMNKTDAVDDAAMSASGVSGVAGADVPGRTVASTMRTTHYSGLHYLRRHPLTARLLESAAEAASQPTSPHGNHATASDDAAPFLAPLLLTPSAIVPFDLPSSNRAAPSARMWEEHQQHLSHCFDSAVDIHSMLQTPAERLALSPYHNSDHRRSLLGGTGCYPFRVIFSESDQGTEGSVLVSAESSERGNLGNTQKPRNDSQTSAVTTLPFN
ncbi:protein kinase, putative [Leishmania tarentolae]|uniref:Protein kinase, putative n=1 Tax=Leishmania tarentolae TaxID=5689 RepID=A0A640KJI5_LEITA|nr:protein kinase, putative [Leishmania tarentolae]